MSQARLGSFTGSFALPTVSGEGNATPASDSDFTNVGATM